jgi:hypothetical protein
VVDEMKITVAKILIVGAGLCLVALVLGAGNILGSMGKGDEMIAEAVVEGQEIEVPSIDAAAPAETATATFALG